MDFTWRQKKSKWQYPIDASFTAFNSLRSRRDSLIIKWYFRQSFDDLHRLWFILYKERNLILTEKQKLRRTVNPVSIIEENRYIKVKRSMAAIKHVLSERQKINNKIRAEELAKTTADAKLL